MCGVNKRIRKHKRHLVFSLSLLLVLSVLVAAPAHGTITSLGFSTGGQNNFSWTATATSGTVVMSFENNEVDASNPDFDPVLNDQINLPDMTLENILKTNVGGLDIITGDLVPDGTNLTIVSDVASGLIPAGTMVMSAEVERGGLLTVGTNFIAYSSDADDLDITDYTLSYSAVIDDFYAAENQGFNLDLSFGGDSFGSLFSLIDNLPMDGSVSGTLSGQITAVPEPATVMLLGLGGLVVLRKKKK